MRKIIFELAFASMLMAAPACLAQSQSKFPPDIMSPAGTNPPAAPKPDRNALPQSDQAPTTPAQQAPATRPAAATATPTANPQHKLVSRKHVSKPSPVPPPEPVQQVPAPPPPPPTPQQMPPSPPQVDYSGGMLTVSAKNSTLLDVLNAVQTRTGAKMSLPPGMNDRVFAQVGPAPPQDVLAKLLSGTNFDYVIVGSPQNPATLSQIIVTARQLGGIPLTQNPPPVSPYGNQSRLPGMGTPAEESENEQQQPAQQQPAVFAPGTAGGPGPFQPNASQAPPGVANPTPFPQTPGPNSQTPAPTGMTPVMPPNQPPQQPPQGSQPKTPEQLLQELKQMQQQKPPKS